MVTLRKVGEIYTENKIDDKYVIKSLEEAGYIMCIADQYGDGSQYIIMQEINNTNVN